MKHMRMGLLIILAAMLLVSCTPGPSVPKGSGQESSGPEGTSTGAAGTEKRIQIEAEAKTEPEKKETDQTETVPETMAQMVDEPPSTTLRPELARYLDGLNGAIVLFDPVENEFWVYNEDLADVRRPPCSTFKIVSSLVGLESGAIDREDSVRPWSGQVFWNDDWNRDMDLYNAFRTSCVWYYRQVIDDIGRDRMQDALEELRYGNCDLSDWEGHLNTNNSDPALTGFWIESSLKISPREQTQVLERIFGQSSVYPSDIRAILEGVMLLSEASQEDCRIYGKTGMGKAKGVVADAWYTGFADVGHRVYFCVYLGETTERDVSSALAREIAVSLIKEEFLTP